MNPLQPHKPAEQISARILFWLSASVGVTMLGMGIIWPIMPIYALQLGASGTELGFIIAAAASVPSNVASAVGVRPAGA